MNILLIQTGISNNLSILMGMGNQNRMNMPMLGLLYIESVTPSDINVKVVDEIHGLVEKFEFYDIVGISGMTMHANRMYYLADQYKRLGCHVVLGGVHVSFMIEEALQHCDTVVVGEGENLWGEFLTDFKNGNAKRVYYPVKPIDLCELPKLKLKLVDGKAYNPPYGTLNSIVATRGCPNNCSFCCVKKMFNGKFRIRPADHVIKELLDLGDGFIMFQDDNIVGNQQFAEELFTKMIPLKRHWGGQGSINIANNDKVLDLMEISGCNALFVGFESINPKNINFISKSGVNKTEKYKEQIKKLHDKGIRIVGSFIVGFDDDSESVFDDIYEFVENNSIEFPIVNCLTPFPGTDLYKQFESEKRIIDYNWENYTLTNVVIQPKHMSSDRLQYKYNLLSYYLGKLVRGNFFSNSTRRTQF